MKQRPIIFSTPMVQAILDGRKTMTRRILSIQPPDNRPWRLIRLIDSTSKDDTKNIGKLQWGIFSSATHVSERDMQYFKNPYGEPDDVLWVRETWSKINGHYEYKALYNTAVSFNWKPSIHMPRAAARLFLQITDVRVERLHDISDSDIQAEGIVYNQYDQIEQGFAQWPCHTCMAEGHRGGAHMCDDGFVTTAKESFEGLWSSINGPASWDSNPWVWVISFTRLDSDPFL